MSALSHVLDGFFRTEEVSQKDFALQRQIDPTTLNKAVRGAASVGMEVASKIIRGMPNEWQGKALTAWLSDQTPPDLRSLVNVAPNDITMREEPGELPATLSGELRRAIVWLADQALIHVELRDLVLNLFRSLTRSGTSNLEPAPIAFSVRRGKSVPKLSREERVERALAQLREAALRDDLSLHALEDQVDLLPDPKSDAH